MIQTRESDGNGHSAREVSRIMVRDRGKKGKLRNQKGKRDDFDLAISLTILNPLCNAENPQGIKKLLYGPCLLLPALIACGPNLAPGRYDTED